MSQHDQPAARTSKAVLLRHYLGALWRFRRLEGDALQRYQDRLAAAAVRKAVAGSAYYADRYAGSDLADWRHLPTTDKRTMMTDFTAFNTRRISGDLAMETALRAERERDFRPLVPGTDLTVGLSSGTSGHRGLFLVGPNERAAWAGALLARALPGPLLRPGGGWRVALFHRAGSNLYQSLASRALTFQFVDLMTPLPDAVVQLNRFLPHLLVGPPTLLALLAEERRAGRLIAQPGKIISVAEVLEPQDAAPLAAAFDVSAIHQIYQCTEGLLAVTCPAGRLHLQEDIVAVQTEPLDAADTTVVTPIVTDLWRQVQPILRYRLNDVLRLSPDTAPRCTCGSAFRVIAQIDGRQDDVLAFPVAADPGEEMRPFFPDTLRRAVLLADAGILDYRILQEAPGSLRVHLACASESAYRIAEQTVRESLSRTVAGYGCRIEGLDIYFGLPPERPGVKRRRVQCGNPAGNRTFDSRPFAPESV